MPTRAHLGIAAVLAAGLLVITTGLSAERQDIPPTDVTTITADEFFVPTTVWDAHLTMTASAWSAMQPRYSTAGGLGFGRFLGPPGGRNGVAARQGVQFDYAQATLDIGEWRFPNVAARYKGNGSYLRARGSEKISIKVDLNKFVKGQKLAGLTTLNFQNNITDIGWMNEVLSYRLYRDAGALAPRTTYARVYLSIDGQAKRYLGLYSVSENVDENFLDDRFGRRTGAIFKPSTSELFTDWGTDWNVYNQSYDPKTDLTDAEKARLIEFGRLVSRAPDADFAARIGDFVDLDDFARYFSVLVWIANADSLLQNGQNFYTFLHPRTNKMHFIAWDQDGSFGNFRNNASGWTIHYPWSGNNLFLSRIYATEAFRTKYLAKMAELSETLFLPDRFLEQVKEIGPAIRPSIAEEGALWLSAFDQVAAGTAGIVPYTRARAAFVKSELLRK